MMTRTIAALALAALPGTALADAVPADSCGGEAACAQDLVCARFTQPCVQPVEPCPDGGCPPPISCDGTPELTCAPPWVLPCEDALDCGTGFTCGPVEVCTCVTEPSSGGEESCYCEDTERGYCRAETIACSNASSCPDDWSCEVGLCYPPHARVFDSGLPPLDGVEPRYTSGTATDAAEPIPMTTLGDDVQTEHCQGASTVPIGLLVLWLCITLQRQRAR